MWAADSNIGFVAKDIIVQQLIEDSGHVRGHLIESGSCDLPLSCWIRVKESQAAAAQTTEAMGQGCVPQTCVRSLQRSSLGAYSWLSSPTVENSLPSALVLGSAPSLVHNHCGE